MDLQLSGQVAIVTGSSRGIGAAVARVLAREGASVVVNYSRDREGAESVVAEIEAAGGRAAPCQADIADPAAAEALVQFAIARFGKLEILVNNAGAVARTPFLQATLEELDRMIAVNFKGTWNCSKAAAAHMVERRYGRIVNCSSGSAIMPLHAQATYAASKAAVQSLTLTMAGELAPYNILVNAYVPGTFDTPMARPSFSKRPEATKAAIPLRRVGQPEEIAAVVAFLASPINTYMVGAMVRVNGGKFTLQNPMVPWQEAGLIE